MKKLYPPFPFLLALGLMWLLSHYFPHLLLVSFSVSKWVDLGIMGLGMLAIVLGLGQMIMHKAEYHPFQKPTKLLSKGIFAISRNPIYLGFLTILVGYVAYTGYPLLLIFPILFFCLFHYWYIPNEEIMMRQEFKAAFTAYEQRTRRWI